MSGDARPEAEGGGRARERPKRTPRGTLNMALGMYIVVNLAYGIPLLLAPDLLWGTVAGADEAAKVALRTTRWGGAILVAWAVGAFLLMAVPRGQRTFFTTLALQYSLAAAAIVFSILTGEWDDAGVAAWFPWLSAVVIAAGALYLWLARLRARDLLNE